LHAGWLPAYRMGVGEYYHLLGCDALLLSNALDEHTASIFRVSRSHTVWGLLTPATDGKVHHQTQRFLNWCQQKAPSLSMLSNYHFHWTILCVTMASYSAHATINSPFGEENSTVPTTLFPVYSCTVKYAFHGSPQTLLITCHQYLYTVTIPCFIDIKSFRSDYGPGVDSASNRNEYQEYFLGVRAAGA